MRKLILALVVLAGGLSSVQDVEAGWGRRRCWRPRVTYRKVYHPVRDRLDQTSEHSGVYYDSGIAFEYDWGPTTPLLQLRRSARR